MTPHIYIDKNRIVKLAELPEEPIKGKMANIPESRDEVIYEAGIYDWKEAVKQALSEAIPFEDQERVGNMLPTSAWTLNKETGDDELIPGTYPLPPGFPKWEKVTQMEIMDQFVQMKWIDVTSDFPQRERNKDIDPTLFRTIIRLVEEKKEESKEELLSDLIDLYQSGDQSTEVQNERVLSKFTITRKPV